MTQAAHKTRVKAAAKRRKGRKRRARRTVRVRAPRLYAKQHAAIFDEARFSIIEASTKAGKTLGCIVWQIAQIFARPGHHWWIAPIVKTAKIAFERAQKMLPPELFEVNITEREIRFVNGSVWSFKSAHDDDSLYGEDVESAVIDEASRCKEGTFKAVRSTLTATQGNARIIGNVKGRGNWFYKIAKKAAGGASGYAHHRLTAWDAVEGGVLALEEIMQAKADLTADEFAELYEAKATEDGTNPFGLGNLRRLKLDEGQWVERLGDTVAWGIDLANSTDWTVMIGLDEAGEICAFRRWQKIGWRATVKRIQTVMCAAHTCAPGELEGAGVQALTDATGVGAPIVSELNELEGDPEDPDDAVFQPFIFTSSSKKKLMGGLALDISSSAFAIPDGVIYEELEAFEYQHTKTGVSFGAPAGLHDDAVCALALARAQYKARDVWTPWW